MYPDLQSAIIVSLQVSLLATGVGFPMAVGLGWLFARREFRGKSLLSMVCLLPVVLPPVVTGYFILQILGVHSPIGRWFATFGIQIPFTLTGAALAALVVGLPFFIMGARAAFEAVDPALEQLAHSLGHPPLKTFCKVTLPLAWPGILGGAVLAFARSLGEFGATVVVAGNMEGETRTIALAVYSLLDLPDGLGKIGVFVGVSVVLAFLALCLYEAMARWQRRRLLG